MSRLLCHAFTATSLLIAAAAVNAATDLSVAIITTPLSGCALGSSEQVTLKLFNHGDALPAGTRFDVRYSINGATPVVEQITLASALLANSVLTYKFTHAADLSVPGTYRIDAAATINGDANPANNTVSGHVAVNFAPSRGGTLSGPEQAYSGTLMLVDAIGTVRQWEQSTSGGERWKIQESNASTWAFDALTRTTQFRAEVKNGACDPAYSDVWTVNP